MSPPTGWSVTLVQGSPLPEISVQLEAGTPQVGLRFVLYTVLIERQKEGIQMRQAMELDTFFGSKNKDTAAEVKKEIKEVKVIDLPTRVLHWLNAILISSLIILILGYEGLEALGVAKEDRKILEILHAYAGHIFAVTFTLRVIWGFLGNKYARFTDMIPNTKAKIKGIKDNIKWYLGGCKAKPPVSTGHNPLASLFYLALFVVLGLQILTGIALAGIEMEMMPGKYFAGFFTHNTLESIEGFAEEIHEFGLWFVMFFIIAHMVGHISHYVHDKGALIKSMITGKRDA